MFASISKEGDLLVLGIELIGAVCVLGALIWLARRWLLSTPAATRDDGLTLQHLRDMKAQGQITDTEFEALKGKVLESSRLSAGRKGGASSLDRT